MSFCSAMSAFTHSGHLAFPPIAGQNRVAAHPAVPASPGDAAPELLISFSFWWDASQPLIISTIFLLFGLTINSFPLATVKS